jgi:hypothetical protein
MTATPKRQVSRTTPRNTTMVRNTASLSLDCDAVRPRGGERKRRLGAGGLGVEQGVHASSTGEAYHARMLLPTRP